MTQQIHLTEEDYLQRQHERRRLTLWVRGGLLALVLLPVGVFVVATQLDPYRDGRVWLEETHTQLGLTTCSFRKATGVPCPSCGMTSSFALFVRGDLLHSLQANAAGTLLAMMSLLFVVWGVVSVVKGRMLWLNSWEQPAVVLVLSFFSVMVVRWGIVLLLHWLS